MKPFSSSLMLKENNLELIPSKDINASLISVSTTKVVTLVTTLRVSSNH
jgi:hypothetical protein